MALRISNPGVRILLGGLIVNDAGNLVSFMDLDGVADDTDGALGMTDAAWPEVSRP